MAKLTAKLIFITTILFLGGFTAANAQVTPITNGESAQEKGAVTGLPIPRFVSLRADKVNLRTGPGPRYPVDWVYQRKGLPVEVIAEFDTWRKIRDWEGVTGWVHQSLLSGKRTIRVMRKTIAMREKANDRATPIAWLEDGVIAKLDTCKGNWCVVERDDLKGWIHKQFTWGVYLSEGLKDGMRN